MPAPGDERSFLNTLAKRNQSLATLHLAWLRLELASHRPTRTCMVVGSGNKYLGPTGEVFDPQTTSKAVHLVHDFPIDYGFSQPWPTDLSQWHAARWNVSVESNFCNKWLHSWRLLAPLCTLARRTEWYLSTFALYPGFTPLTDAQTKVIRDVGANATRTLSPATVISQSEQSVLAKALLATLQ